MMFALFSKSSAHRAKPATSLGRSLTMAILFTSKVWGARRSIKDLLSELEELELEQKRVAKNSDFLKGCQASASQVQVGLDGAPTMSDIRQGLRTLDRLASKLMTQQAELQALIKAAKDAGEKPNVQYAKNYDDTRIAGYRGSMDPSPHSPVSELHMPLFLSKAKCNGDLVLGTTNPNTSRPKFYWPATRVDVIFKSGVGTSNLVVTIRSMEDAVSQTWEILWELVPCAMFYYGYFGTRTAYYDSRSDFYLVDIRKEYLSSKSPERKRLQLNLGVKKGRRSDFVILRDWLVDQGYLFSPDQRKAHEWKGLLRKPTHGDPVPGTETIIYENGGKEVTEAEFYASSYDDLHVECSSHSKSS